MVLNLTGVARTAKVVKLIAIGSAVLAFGSALIPVLFGTVDWGQSTSWDLTQPFEGVFGGVTSAMAGLYLIGFAAPAFEAATCHVGETRDPEKNVPRAVFASGLMASVYFLVLPVVWLGVFGADGLNVELGADLAQDLGPTFAPLLGAAGKAAAIWFMVLNMFHGTVQPLAGASRTLSQCAEDGLLPEVLVRRNRSDAPWVATLLTAGAGDRLPARRRPGLDDRRGQLHLPHQHRPAVDRGLAASPARTRRAALLPRPAGHDRARCRCRAVLAVLDAPRLPAVPPAAPSSSGSLLAYSGSALYAWRVRSDRIARGARRGWCAACT